jgi:short-chain fatty acids transporter
LVGWLETPSGFSDMVYFWGQGFWELLAFSMQMALILILGHTIALSPFVQKGIIALVQIPRSARSASALTAFVVVLTSFLNWGLGLIVGAILAKQLGVCSQKNGRPIHYPLVCAAGYSGLLVWHGGFSGSAPLLLASSDHSLVASIGILPISDTILSSFNILNSIILLIFIPIIFWFMTPLKGPYPQIPAELSSQTKLSKKSPFSDPGKNLNPLLKHCLFLNFLMTILILTYFGVLISRDQFQFDLNTVNLLLLALGLFLFRRPGKYLEAFEQGTPAASGILLLFPLYAGIMAMMKDSGLAQMITQFFVAISTAKTLPFWTFLSAGFVNLFIPSGGGQWVIQGPIVLQAAQELGTPLNRIVMAVAYGDQWTNMLQPFWAIPLLGITRIKAHEIMGFTALLMVLSTCIFLISLLIV